MQKKNKKKIIKWNTKYNVKRKVNEAGTFM